MPAPESRDESFDVETNSPFYFNTSHWRAVDGMLEGVRERAGLMILTGPTGSGKTMIMRAISEGLEENTPGLFLQYASLNFREFVNFLHSSLRVEDEVIDAPNKAVALREFLYVQAKRDETGVVFIDEAHNLEPDVLKMLPKLARFDTLEDGRVVGLQFVLIGSEDLREIMRDPEYDEVRAKIAVDHTLRFFTRAELKQFLKKRLAPIARMTDEPITEDGIEEMGKYTGGSPRLIGMICSHTMLFAAENPGKSIDAKMVEEAAEALMLQPVDNPFADEENDPKAASGPFSEADMSGETPSPAASSLPPAFSATETVYATDDEDGPSKPEGDGTDMDATGDADASLYASDHAVMKDAEARVEDSDPDEDADDAEPEEFDHAAFDRAFDDDDDDFDDDLDDLDDLDDDGEGDAVAVAPKKPAVKKGGTSFLSRLGIGAKKDEPAKVVGASRKKGGSATSEAVPVVDRGPKAVVAGDREKRRKTIVAAATVIAVAGLGAVAYKPVVGAVTGMFAKPRQVAAAPSPTQVQPFGEARTASTGTPPPLPAPTAAQATEQRPTTVTVVNERAPSGGGWGARVVVDKPGEAPSPASPAPVRTANNERALPAPVASVAKGALDLVDRALGVGERNASSDKVGGVLSAAAGQVAGLRNRLANDGLTPAQAAAKASKLVSEGDAHFASRRYIAPKGASAYDAYREALSLQPKNEKAKAGIASLREHYAKKAEGARSARQWESANAYFETAIAISNLRPLK